MPRVVVLEDYEPLARALLRAMNSAFGDGQLDPVVVTWVPSCAKARQLSGRFDLAIVDLELPDGRGVDVAAEMLSESKVEAVTFFTACQDPDQIRMAAELGRVVDKAAGIRLLIETVRRALGRESLQRAVGDDEVHDRGCGSSGRSGTRRIGG